MAGADQGRNSAHIALGVGGTETVTALSLVGTCVVLVGAWLSSRVD